MTDAPKTIWAWEKPSKMRGWHTLAKRAAESPTHVQYTLTTHSDALVAAAYEDNCVECCGTGKDGAGDVCHHRTPANAQAAYDAAIAQARRKGWEVAKTEAAKVAYAQCAETRHVTLGIAIEDAIQALEYKEPET